VLGIIIEDDVPIPIITLQGDSWQVV
jgi:hypothetical protein